MKIYSLREAAEFCGISYNTIRHHVYKSKKLKPQRLGETGTFYLTQSQLEAFKNAPRKSGRPRKVKAKQ